MAKVNPIRWSTQYTDDETDLVMYLRRPYSPSTGRWLSRDPMEEKGGANLYGFAGNDAVNRIDVLGLRTWVPYPHPGHWVEDTQPPPPQPDQVGFALCMRNVNPEGLGDNLLKGSHHSIWHFIVGSSWGMVSGLDHAAQTASAIS